MDGAAPAGYEMGPSTDPEEILSGPKISDVVIVGGGVIGSAIAYFLAADPGFDGRITVIERDPTYRTASTPRSAGGVRQQFSNPENIEIGLFGHHFVTHVGDYLAVDGEVPDLGFVEGGYLFLAGPDGLDILSENHAVQRRFDCAITLLPPDRLAARFPWLSVEGLSAGAVGERGEGWLDPNTLLQAFKRKARTLGAVYETGEVVAIAVDGGRATSVTLADGRKIAGGIFVNAAGPNAGRVAGLAGIALPVVPRKRFVYVFDCRETLSPAVPLTIDPSGVYVRPEGRGYICGVSPPEDADPDGETSDLDVEYGLFEEIVWPTLAQRIPAFEAIKLTGAWAGHYDYNTADQNGIVGPHPEIRNVLFANGFSGHGLQQSPAVGRAIAELVVHGRFRTIDLSRFSYERLASGRLVLERNIV